MSFIVQTGKVIDPGPLQDSDGYLYRWATIVTAAESLAEVGGGVSYQVLVSGDQAAVVGKLTESGNQPLLVFAGRYTAVVDAHGVLTHQVDAGYVGLSLNDPSFGATGSSAIPSWE